VEIVRMGPHDAKRVSAAAHIFDNPPVPDALKRFLADPTHHLLIAYSADEPAGFVSGVEVTHPDKGTEMFLYELAVDTAHRHHGIGTALVRALATSDLPREGAVYRASLNSAVDLTGSLGRLKWQILDQLAALAAGGSAKADAAASTWDQLRSAACHDEHQVPLRKALDQAEQAAIALLIEAPRLDEPQNVVVQPQTAWLAGAQPTVLPLAPAAGADAVTRRVTAGEVASVAEELCETADQNPEASFDISWRIVTG